MATTKLRKELRMAFLIITSAKADYTSPLISQLETSNEITLLTDETLLEKNIRIHSQDKFYLPSDTTYSKISHLLDESWQKRIESFRNKYAFRQKLKKVFPDFYFDRIAIADLKNHVFNFKKNSNYIIKPETGFMAGGVYEINEQTDTQQIAEKLNQELNYFKKIYPNIFSDKLMIEEYVDGDEYAVDMYYDDAGNPVILNIYHHPASNSAYPQLLYYTCQTIFDQHHQSFYHFFKKLNASFEMKSFPIHAEFKYSSQKKLIPIEFNVCRFGGMGLADLTYYTFGINPVEHFFNNQKLNFEKAWKKNKDNYYGWLLAYNASGYDTKLYQPDREKFKKFLSEHVSIIHDVSLNYKTLPAFAIIYFSTKNIGAIKTLLSLEFKKYFVKK